MSDDPARTSGGSQCACRGHAMLETRLRRPTLSSNSRTKRGEIGDADLKHAFGARLYSANFSVTSVAVSISVWIVGDEQPASRGSRILSCCTSGGRVRVSCREIKACRFYPRILSPEKNPPNRRDLPSLERGAEEENLAYSSVAECAIGARTSPGDPAGG
jgi:hypothetical protein